jgi:hypothetical protein
MDPTAPPATFVAVAALVALVAVAAFPLVVRRVDGKFVMLAALKAGALLSVGAADDDPVPCETRTWSVAAVLPASMAVVDAAL